MKNSIQFIILLVFAIMFSGCTSEKNEGKQKTETFTKKEQAHETTSHSSDRPANNAIQTSGESVVTMTGVSQWERPLRHTVYEPNPLKCFKNKLASPVYVDDKVIVFQEILEGKDRIVQFSRDSQNCQSLYEANGIGMVAGTNGKLFWPEYDTRKLTDVDWMIKSYDLRSKKIEVIRKGGSYKETPPPTISVKKDSINWIEYETKGDIVKSKLMQYEVATKKTEELVSAVLDESAKRNGEYYYLQKSAGNGILLYKTIFKDGNKSFDIGLYNPGTSPKSYVKQDRIIDFAGNSHFFVYTGEGGLKVKNLAANEIIEYNTGDRLTTDSPILFGDHFLLFRYAMNQIFLCDLQKKVYFPVTNYESLTSKPLQNEQFIMFATVDENDITRFHVIDVNG